MPRKIIRIAGKPSLAAYVAVAMLALHCSQSLAADVAWVWHSSDAPGQPRELAVLLDHLVLSGESIDIRRRMRPLMAGRDVTVTPVVHVQTDIARPAPLGERQTRAITAALRAAAAQSTSGWVQLDFEARESQKADYLKLVTTLRAALPSTVRLSVTVLASWCDDAATLAALPVQEVVPMFFRMGAHAPAYRKRLETAPQSLAARCRDGAAGFAVQEAPAAAVTRRYARRYWFNYKNWNTDATMGVENAWMENGRLARAAGGYRTARHGGAAQRPADLGQGRAVLE